MRGTCLELPGQTTITSSSYMSWSSIIKYCNIPNYLPTARRFSQMKHVWTLLQISRSLQIALHNNLSHARCMAFYHSEQSIQVLKCHAERAPHSNSDSEVLDRTRSAYSISAINIIPGAVSFTWVIEFYEALLGLFCYCIGWSLPSSLQSCVWEIWFQNTNDWYYLGRSVLISVGWWHLKC